LVRSNCHVIQVLFMLLWSGHRREDEEEEDEEDVRRRHKQEMRVGCSRHGFPLVPDWIGSVGRGLYLITGCVIAWPHLS
jgi:hypothetical protein